MNMKVTLNRPYFFPVSSNYPSLGLKLCRERQSMANFNMLDSRLGRCLQTAWYRLSDKKEGQAQFGNAKYTFKWKQKTWIQLYCFSCMKYAHIIVWIGFGLWIVAILLTTATPYVYLAKVLRFFSF